jgi:hypothetical protein
MFNPLAQGLLFEKQVSPKGIQEKLKFERVSCASGDNQILERKRTGVHTSSPRALLDNFFPLTELAGPERDDMGAE